MYSTVQAAEQSGIPLSTLNRWIAQERFKAPTVRRVGNIPVRLWTETDIRRLQRYHKAHFREGMGRRTDLQSKRSRKRK